MTTLLWQAGILPMLNEEAHLPDPSDEKLLRKMTAAYADGKHACYSTHFKTPKANLPPLVPLPRTHYGACVPCVAHYCVPISDRC